DECPRLACVVRAVKTAARLCFDERIDTIWIGVGDGEIGFADQLVGQTIRDLRKVFATVSALVETAFATAADDGPGLTFQVRHPCVDDVWIAWLQLDIHSADSV